MNLICTYNQKLYLWFLLTIVNRETTSKLIQSVTLKINKKLPIDLYINIKVLLKSSKAMKVFLINLILQGRNGNHAEPKRFFMLPFRSRDGLYSAAKRGGTGLKSS